MNDLLETWHNKLELVNIPEEIFGYDPVLEKIHSEFTKIASVIHPDKWGTDTLKLHQANEAFKLLNNLHGLAKDRVKSGLYGVKNVFKEIVITTKKTTYTLYKLLAEGDIASTFLAKDKLGCTVVVKIVRNAVNNDLLDVEKDTLSYLHNTSVTKETPIMDHILPDVLDSFEYVDGMESKKILVLCYIQGTTVSDIITKNPKGIAIQDAAWMINRLLGALAVTYQSKIVHGAIVPDNFILDLKTHNGILIDWAFSVKENTKLSVISTKYKDYYPAEVFTSNPVNSGLDLYMLATMFIHLIGGDYKTKTFPTNTPTLIKNVFQACFLGPRYRILDPYELHEDFKNVLKLTYGEPKFREFKNI